MQRKAANKQRFQVCVPGGLGDQGSRGILSHPEQVRRVRASEKALRKVGHMPQEDYPQVVADAVDEFLASDLKVSALGSVRGRKVLVDDGQG